MTTLHLVRCMGLHRHPSRAWLRESAKDDQRRFEMLRSDLTNRRVLDLGLWRWGVYPQGAAMCFNSMWRGARTKDSSVLA